MWRWSRRLRNDRTYLQATSSAKPSENPGGDRADRRGPPGPNEPGKMVDEFMAYMKNSDGTLALDNLRRQARENPMALAMIGSGFAWLMFGGGGGAASTARPDDAYAADYADYSPRGSTATSGQDPSWDREGGGWPGWRRRSVMPRAGFLEKASGLLDRATGAALSRYRSGSRRRRNRLRSRAPSS